MLCFDEINILNMKMYQEKKDLKIYYFNSFFHVLVVFHFDTGIQRCVFRGAKITNYSVL